MLVDMGSVFGEKLTKAREAAGLSGYKLVQITGIAQGNLQAIERGRRAPSDANLEALAAVPELGVALEQLQAWRDLDRIGIEGIERIKRWVPEVLKSTSQGVALGVEQASSVEKFDALDLVREQFPKGMKHPPTARELKVLAQLGDLAAWSLTPGEPLWQDAPSERWPEIKGALEAWQENQKDADSATR